MEKNVLSKFVKTLESEGKLNCESLKLEIVFRENFKSILENPNIPIEQKVKYENSFEDLLNAIKEDYFELGFLAKK
ncbi:MAG: hypothetical protein Q4A58_03915 [Fusobacterium sp.]|uniref:hypothetical protein n=1 Tax=Fusobacterium sp. TaxID=68766 RepID=UPI0026DCE048|nr:hypothetical protein [Fusobacterium sp.]MDO4690424.1 hypothetical protein [Fusobacterium sp.]